jgi:membrane fusion protein (multidrug efflux system)
VVSSGTPIASLQSVTPIYADFWMPQQALADLKVKERARLRVNTFPGSTWDGEVVTINPEVDVATRNVRVRASFTNADGRLRPGMFGTVEVVSSTKRDVLAIPVTSVIYAPYGDSVFTIDKGDGGKQTAKQKFVRLGEQRGDFVEVTNGLQQGETVVSNGAFKLRSGTAVAVNNALAPKYELAPSPENK